MSPVKATLNFYGIDKMIERLEKMGVDIDQAAIDAVRQAAPIVEGEMHRLAKENRLTGATEEAIFSTEVKSEGSFHYVEIGAKTDDNSAAVYNEFGTVRMGAQSFIRPAFRNTRHRWRNKVKQVLESYLQVSLK
jgi:HK97 gp10 family phage protein